MKTIRFCSSFTSATFVVVAMILFLAGERTASAQSVLEVIAGGVTNYGTPSVGANSFTGAFADGWDVNSVNGVVSAAGLDVNSLDVSTTGTSDSLTIIFSSPSYGPGMYQASASANITPGLNVVFTSYYGAATPSMDNVLAPSINISSSAVSDTSTGVIPSGGPYSLTEEIVISGATAPSSLSSLNYSLQAVPEPSTIALLLVGGGTMVCRRFKTRQAKV